MVLDYYAYWNGTQIRDLFEALVAVCSGPSYGGLLKSAVLAGFLCTITGALLKWQGLSAKVYLLSSVLFYFVMFVPKVDIAVHDERSADVSVVANVPMGIGFFASMTSRIGHFLTEQFEGAFSLPDSERFSRFGLVYPQRALNALLSAGPITPEGRSKTERVIKDCVGPELMDHPEKAQELSTAGDLWAAISAPGWINSARSSLTEDGSIQNCEAALEDLDQYLESTETDFLTKRLGSVLVPERVDPANVIRRTLPQAEALLLGVSRTLEASLKHSVLLTSLPKGLSSIAEQAGAPLEVAAAFAASQSNLASELNYRTLARLAEHSLPKIRNCVEFIVIAAFPFMLILMVAAGCAAGSVFRSFFVLLIWFQLWAPLCAVANYLMITVDANPMNRIAAEFGGSTILAAGIIQEAGATSQAIAGSIMMLIPVIAFALAKGSDMAFVSMASALLSPAQGASSAASSQASSGSFTAGNVSLGNASTNSISGNKADFSSSWTDPYASKTQTAFGSVTRDAAGLVTGMQRTSIDLGVTSSGSLNHQKASLTSFSSAQTLSSSVSRSFSYTTGAASSNALTGEFVRAMSEGLSKNQSINSLISAQQSASVALSAQDVSGVSRGLSNSESFTFSSGAKLNVGAGQALIESGSATSKGVPQTSQNTPSSLGLQSASGLTSSPTDTQTAGASLEAARGRPSSLKASLSGLAEGAGVGLSADTKTLQQLMDTATNAQSAATQRQRAHAYSALRSTAESIASSSADEAVRRAAESFTTSLDKAYRSLSDQSTSSLESRSSNRSLSENLTGSDQTSVNQDVSIMNRLLSSGNHSAEVHLEALFRNSELKENLGAFAAAENYARNADGRHLGSSQVNGEVPTASRLNALSRERLGEAKRKADSIIGKKTEAFKTQASEFTEVRPHSSPKQEEFTGEYERSKYVQSHELVQRSSEAELRHEALQEAAGRYQTEEKGVSVAMGIALAGGALYKDPLIQKDNSNHFP